MTGPIVPARGLPMSRERTLLSVFPRGPAQQTTRLSENATPEVLPLGVHEHQRRPLR